MSTNIILILGLRRRVRQRRNRLGKRKANDWREQSVILYVFLSSMTFILLTSPAGIFTAWSIVTNQKMTTSNLVIVLDLIEIIHHCSHFPILLSTSSIIRRKTFQMLCRSRLPREHSMVLRQLNIQRIRSEASTRWKRYARQVIVVSQLRCCNLIFRWNNNCWFRFSFFVSFLIIPYKTSI